MKCLAVAVCCVLVSVAWAGLSNPAILAPNGFSAGDLGNANNEFGGDEPQPEQGYNLYGDCAMAPNKNGMNSFADRVTGTLNMNQQVGGKYTTIKVNLTGFDTHDANIYHGIHVHEWGDLSGGCETAGDHYNPLYQDHGAQTDDAVHRHFGDLGNLQEDANGNIVVEFTDPILALEGPFSVFGRTIAVTQNYDDLGKTGLGTSSKDGNSGKLIACCVIGRTDGSDY